MWGEGAECGRLTGVKGRLPGMSPGETGGWEGGKGVTEGGGECCCDQNEKGVQKQNTKSP